MSSSSDVIQRREGKAPADPLKTVPVDLSQTAPAGSPEPTATAAAGKTNTNMKKKKKVRMTQEQIDSFIRYQTVYFPEDLVPRVSKERLAQTNLADQGNLPVPMDQIDDYIANIFRDINRMEARFMRERDRILNDYYTKGYAEEEITDDEEEEEEGGVAPARAAAPAPPGRRRFRPGVAKQAGKIKKLN
ncbi:uncharacterized protein LOC133886182 [Phragmites australis]|uniref:uncharacterized protein LOC133886182 n=1 Tax=Phragmites australis TaxID=29695 RepID=UPI002D7678EF|nr:uncharacterized protein LOC133886182 [Phragmites australis]